MKNLIATILAVCCCAVSSHAEVLTDSNVASTAASSPPQPDDLQIAQNTPADQTAPSAPAPQKHKSAATAAVLSVLFPGAGNFYTGQKRKGSIVMGTAFAGFALMGWGTDIADKECINYSQSTCNAGTGQFLGGMAVFMGAWFYGLISSIHRAEDINSGKVVALDRLRLSFPVGKKVGVQVAYKFEF